MNSIHTKRIVIGTAVAAITAVLIAILATGPIESQKARDLRTPTQPTPFSTAPPSPAPPSPGKRLFTSSGACSTCHAVAGLSRSRMGPSLNGIATTAARRIPDITAEQYIRQSITAPNAYNAGIRDGHPIEYPPGLMASVVDNLRLTPKEIDALVDFLMTLD